MERMFAVVLLLEVIKALFSLKLLVRLLLG